MSIHSSVDAAVDNYVRSAAASSVLLVDGRHPRRPRTRALSGVDVFLKDAPGPAGGALSVLISGPAAPDPLGPWPSGAASAARPRPVLPHQPGLPRPNRIRSPVRQRAKLPWKIFPEPAAPPHAGAPRRTPASPRDQATTQDRAQSTISRSPGARSIYQTLSEVTVRIS